MDTPPAPGDPAPGEPTPVEPTPVEPTPVEPTPVEPTPIEPAPYAPVPYAQPPFAPPPATPSPYAPPPATPPPYAQPPYPPPPYAPPPYAPNPAAPTTTVNVNVQTPQIVIAPPSGPGFLVRAVWYLFVGWWLTGIVIVVAYFCALSIIGLPVAFYLFNRIPTFLTLRGRTTTYATHTDANGVTYLTARNVAQLPMWQRAIWFVFIGWWAGAIWMGIAWVLCLLIFTLPIGIMMFDRTGGVMTLLRY